MKFKFYRILTILIFIILAPTVRSTSAALWQNEEEEPTPVEACIVPRDALLSALTRAQFASCLDWEENKSYPRCQGNYKYKNYPPVPANSIEIKADKVSLAAEGGSELTGNVIVKKDQQVIHAKTAYIYRDAKTHKVTRIELLGGVRYEEPDRLILAKKVTLNPEMKTGEIEEAIYRVKTSQKQAILPGWGRASRET